MQTIFNNDPKFEDSVEKINLDILQGKLTIDDAIETGKINLNQIQEWQSQYFITAQSGKPWEKILETIWNFAVRGKRKLVTIPLFLVLLVLPAIATLYESSSKLWVSISSAFATNTSEMDASELDVCNEHVIRVGIFGTKEEARKEKDYLYETMTKDNEWTWVDDIHVVRDLDSNNKFLLIIDTYDGSSDKKTVTSEISFLQSINPNGLGNKLIGAQPYFYSQRLFELLYGKLSAKATKCKYSEP